MDLTGKNFLAFVDNGDGTCTNVISWPEGSFELTTVLEISFEDMIRLSAAAAIQIPEMVDEVVSISTVIPNDAEGVSDV